MATAAAAGGGAAYGGAAGGGPGRCSVLDAALERRERGVLLLGVVAAALLRLAVGAFPHSGEATPPMFGDFEAQRHWMEITTSLPAAGWYLNSTDNDLLYWGLDYPPLTAYHSLVLGWLGGQLVPECFRLHASRGHESLGCRRFMRASVVISDLLVYLPGSAVAVWCFADKQERAPARVASLLLLWFLPPLVLIDHGHFQYNGVCLGLCLAAAGCVATGRVLMASVFFTCGLLFKQIALYYAPAFFFGILAHCLRRSQRPAAVVGRVALVGAAVLGTTALLFALWLRAPEPAAAVAQVVHRMFPFARGLYEDKVASVWCTISVVVKLHSLLPPRRVPLVCAACTLAALLPSCLYCLRPRLLRRRDGGAGAFAAALSASPLAFFLFAFHVHEKSILFPCVMVCLLPLAFGAGRRPDWVPALLCHFLLVCMFSMYPLVVKDELQVPYVGLCAVLGLLCEATFPADVPRRLMRTSFVAGLGLHALHALVPPPSRYPDAWTLLITGTSCGYFVACLAGVSWLQLSGAFEPEARPDPRLASGKRD